MEAATAEIIFASPKKIYQSMGVPMALADAVGDNEIGRSIAKLCAMMCTEIGLNIVPAICKNYPDLSIKIERDHGLASKPLP